MYWLKKKKLPWREFGVFSCIAAPWFIFSLFYFDSLFPTSLQEKRGYADFAFYCVDSFGYLARYCDRYNFHLFSWISQSISPLLVPFPLFSRNITASSLATLYLLFTAFSVIYYLKNAQKHHFAVALLYLYPPLMIITLGLIGPPPEHRWHLTAAVNFALLGQLNLFTTPLLAWLKMRHPSSALNRRFAITIALISMYLLYFTALNLKDFYTTSRDADRSLWFGARYSNYKNIGCFLKDAVSDEETVFVLEVGTMGYYSMKKMIDGAGIIAPGYGRYHREGCWLMGMERGFPDYIVTWEMAIPFYEPVFYYQNIFGKMAVYRKSKNLPEDSYPFSQLLHNWRKWKERRT